MAYTGSCLCKAVTINISSEPLVARACWCRTCQFLGSGNATINAAFLADTVNITGPVTWFNDTADSGNQMSRGFCGKCGTPMFSKGTRTPDRLVVRLGVFDDINAITPKGAIWTSSAPDWAEFDPHAPQHSHQPPAVN
jgi:hypothetical protein